MMISVPFVRSPLPWRRMRAATGWVLYVAAVIGITTWLITGPDVELSSWRAGIVGMGIAMLGIPLAVRGMRSRPGPDQSAHLDELTETLAVAVGAQWRDEEKFRRVHGTLALKTRWVNGPDRLQDRWEHIHGSESQNTPIDLSGQLEQIIDVFERVPSGRLVVLGKGGAGKTILASQFLLQSLERRARGLGGPVPVLFALSSWDPETTSLRTWLEGQLGEIISPYLAADNAQGKSPAARLLENQRIILVLDGFDEILPASRQSAVERINEALHPGDRLLLTSRPEEYAAAVAQGVPEGAAVVEMVQLTPAQIITHLPLSVPKSANVPNKWDPVLNSARTQPRHRVLLAVLATPLMLGLARTIYSKTDADPAELLTILDQRAGEPVDELRRALELRLLDGFIPAVYSRTYRRLMPNLRPYSVEDAARWFGFLARHLQARNTKDLAWWQLIFAVPKLVVGVAAGATIALTVWLAVGFVGWAGAWQGSPGRAAWLTATLVGGLICGIVGGLLMGQGRGIRRTPARVRLRAQGRGGEIVRDVLGQLRSWRTRVWVLVWTLGGAIFGILPAGSYEVVLIGCAAGIFAGSGTWLVVALIRAMAVPIDPKEAMSPRNLLRIDRSTALRQGLGVGAGGACAFWCMMWFAFEPAFGLGFNDVLGDGRWVLGWWLTLCAGLLSWALFFPVWGPWCIARVYLPLRRKIPWKTMTFLDDAHQSGVLRRVGGLYEFRHSQLRDQLADP
ncbi:NACHT domain-containing protein [Nocardia sp. NPDC051832]|uniref:NACHT domain-containing protein n=1 Tax=Nocardia sp. NPDC051832 TaxID=3155673 RepID=UPI00341ADF7B